MMPAKRGGAVRNGIEIVRQRSDRTTGREERFEERPVRYSRPLHAVIALAYAFGVSGCSLWPWQTVPAASVSNDQYIGMSCEELRSENDRLLAEAIDLRPKVAPEQGEEQRKKDVALISGEMDAVNRMRAAKKC